MLQDSLFLPVKVTNLSNLLLFKQEHFRFEKLIYFSLANSILVDRVFHIQIESIDFLLKKILDIKNRLYILLKLILIQKMKQFSNIKE